jgi:hypothetical protein
MRYAEALIAARVAITRVDERLHRRPVIHFPICPHRTYVRILLLPKCCRIIAAPETVPTGKREPPCADERRPRSRHGKEQSLGAGSRLGRW